MRSGNDFEPKPRAGSSILLRVWLLMSGLLGLMLIASSIFYIWLYVQQVRNGYHLSRLSEQQEKLLAAQRKLRLEWCLFEDPFKLQETGRNQFRLGPPRADQKVTMR